MVLGITMNSNNAMKSGWRREWLLAIILVAPFIALAIVWPSLPARVPTHFGLRGNVNHYSGPSGLLILPVINVLVAAILYFIPRLDPKQENILHSMPAYRWIRFWLAAFFTYIFALTLDKTFNPAIEIGLSISLGLFALFFSLGLLMPKLKQNYMIGIRLPWTLESEDNWNRTHAFAGKLWMWGSLIGIVLVLIFQSDGLFIAFGTVIALIVWTIVYSYRIFKRQREHSN